MTVRRGDWRDPVVEAPFDMLVLDGGGRGKPDEPPLKPAGHSGLLPAFPPTRKGVVTFV